MDTMSPQLLHMNQLVNHTPSMRYDGSISFEAWQKAASVKLAELLGMEKFQKVEPSVYIDGEQDTEEFHEIDFTFQSEALYRPLCNLFLPRGVKDPPVVICLMGHGLSMQNLIGRNSFGSTEEIRYSSRRALHAIRRGYAALILEQRGMGMRGGTANGPACLQPAVTAMLLGRTLIGERVWDVMRAIDVLEQFFPQVDSSRIAVSGGSGGGTTSFYAACLEKRISIANPSCSVCSYSESIAPVRHCMCNYIPRIAEYFDMGDLGGLIAPRPLVIDNGISDQIFRIKGSLETAEIIRSLYRAAGAEDKFVFIAGDGGHQFYYEQAWPEFDRLSGWKSN